MTIQAQEFWNKANTTGECWHWLAGKNKAGYGAVWVNGRTAAAHRIAWQLRHGPIPENMCVMHGCDNKACVNPDHLFLHAANRAKLTADDIPMIRALLGVGVSQVEIAKQYGVAKQTISLINTGKIWKDIH